MHWIGGNDNEDDGSFEDNMHLIPKKGKKKKTQKTR